MTNDLAIPAHLARRSVRNLAAASVQGLGVASPPRVSLRQNRFWLVDSAGAATPVNAFTLDVVIADANPAVSKAYYDTVYDPQATEHEAPACWSDNGVGPSANAQKPQSQTCATCPLNQWGSDRSRVSGKETKACTDSKKLAVFVVGGPDTPYLLQVPPASLKHLRAYAQTLSASAIAGRPVDMSDVITRLSFDPTVQGVLNFTAVGWIDEATAGRLDMLEQSPDTTAVLIGTKDMVRTAPVPAPIPAAPIPAALPAPAPVLPQPMHNPLSFVPPQPQGLAGQAPQFAPPPAPVQEAPQAAPAPRTRKPKAAPAPAPQPQFAPPPAQPVAPQAGEVPPIPAFLQRPAAPAPAPAPAPQFGMAAAPAPDAGLQSQLAKAFALPTKG